MTEFMDELPGAATGRSGRRDQTIVLFAQELRDNPRKWAAWPTATTNPSVKGANIRRGKYLAMAEGFETAVRQKVLYVRYVGDTEAESL